MTEIKEATIDDIEWLLPQLKNFSEFYGTQKKLFDDEDFARAGLYVMITQHVMYIAWRDAQRIGFISGLITCHPYNPNIRLLAESFWWVDPAHRKSRAGLMLLDKFTKWGNDNVDWITFSLEHHSPVNDKCLLKRGYKLQERSYLKEV